jgi:hypothetical protein
MSETRRSRCPINLSVQVFGVWRGRAFTPSRVAAVQRQGLHRVCVRKSDAVCALPDGNGYICDAVNARHPLGNSDVGDSTEPVAPCPPELLRRFGFKS